MPNIDKDCTHVAEGEFKAITKLKTMKQKCLKCGKEFDDILYKEKYKSAQRFYCNNCVDKLWKDYKEKNA